MVLLRGGGVSVDHPTFLFSFKKKNIFFMWGVVGKGGVRNLFFWNLMALLGCKGAKASWLSD